MKLIQMNIARIFALLLILILTGSCQREPIYQLSEIKVGEQDYKEVSLNKASTQTIILSGGNGKYSVNIENSRFAKVAINRDTLRITGILEGDTYATILSHQYRRRLPIHVVAPELTASQNEIRLFPRDESRTVSLLGGGDIVDLQVNDPNEVINYKWNAKTGIVEIYPKYEGDATLTAVAPDGKTQSIRVVVRCNGTIEAQGIYSTTSRSLSTKINALMVVHRVGVGVWLLDKTKPSASLKRIKITPEVVNPKVGETIELNLEMRYPSEFRDLSEGKHRFVVDEVREREVILLGKGIKLAIPYRQG